MSTIPDYFARVDEPGAAMVRPANAARSQDVRRIELAHDMYEVELARTPPAVIADIRRQWEQGLRMARLEDTHLLGVVIIKPDGDVTFTGLVSTRRLEERFTSVAELVESALRRDGAGAMLDRGDSLVKEVATEHMYEWRRVTFDDILASTPIRSNGLFPPLWYYNQPCGNVTLDLPGR